MKWKVAAGVFTFNAFIFANWYFCLAISDPVGDKLYPTDIVALNVDRPKQLSKTWISWFLTGACEFEVLNFCWLSAFIVPSDQVVPKPVSQALLDYVGDESEEEGLDEDGEDFDAVRDLLADVPEEKTDLKQTEVAAELKDEKERKQKEDDMRVVEAAAPEIEGKDQRMTQPAEAEQNEKKPEEEREQNDVDMQVVEAAAPKIEAKDQTMTQLAEPEQNENKPDEEREQKDAATAAEGQKNEDKPEVEGQQTEIDTKVVVAAEEKVEGEGEQTEIDTKVVVAAEEKVEGEGEQTEIAKQAEVAVPAEATIELEKEKEEEQPPQKDGEKDVKPSDDLQQDKPAIAPSKKEKKEKPKTGAENKKHQEKMSAKPEKHDKKDKKEKKDRKDKKEKPTVPEKPAAKRKAENTSGQSAASKLKIAEEAGGATKKKGHKRNAADEESLKLPGPVKLGLQSLVIRRVMVHSWQIVV